MDALVEDTQMEEVPQQVQSSKSNSKVWKIVLIVVAIGTLVVACTVLTELFIRPLAAPLFVNEETPTVTAIASVETPAATEQVIPTDSAGATATWKPSACTETGTMSFLVLGVDMPTSDNPKGADAIRLIELDFTSMEATMIVVPRDMWVSTPVLNDQDLYSNRIGLTYYYAKEAAPSGNDEAVYATTLFAQTLYDNFEFVPDHYITFHLDSFDDIVDAMGGITVEVAEEYHSENYVFPAGALVMDGDQALEYASNLLNDDTVWERFARQEQVVDAILEQLTSPSVIFSLPGLITEFGDAVTTDLSLSDMTDLTCLAGDLDISDITTIELGNPYVTSAQDSDILMPDTELISELFADVFD